MCPPALRSVLLEVCVGSIADLEVALQAGVDRIEVNSGLPLGGLTPSAAVLEQAIAMFPQSAVVMVRPRSGGFCYSPQDWLTLLRDADLAWQAGAAGLAFGCLLPDGRIDCDRVKEFVQLAGGRDTIFHRAFDLTPDWREAFESLREAGVRRILTAGWAESVSGGIGTLAQLVQAAQNTDIAIVAGGGVRANNIAEIVFRTGVRELHGTFSQTALDPGYDSGRFRLAAGDSPRATSLEELRRVRDVLTALPNRLHPEINRSH